MSVIGFQEEDRVSLTTVLQTLGVASFLAFSSTSAGAQSQQEALRDKNAVKGKVEHSADVVEYIYVARSVRISGAHPFHGEHWSVTSSLPSVKSEKPAPRDAALPEVRYIRCSNRP